MFKGQQEILTPIILMGITVAVISSVYFWGVPLIEKNKDSLYLRKSEIFMNELSDEIKYVANNGGREEINFNVPGNLRFFPDENYIEMNITTDGTIYSSKGEIYFVMTSGNIVSGSPIGVWGKDEPFILKAYTKNIGDKYMTSYNLQFIPICSGSRCYMIDLEGNRFVVGGNHKIIIENIGTEGPSVDNNGHEVTYSKIKISFL